MPVCERCGIEMKRITVNHQLACKIPLPSVLARVWLDSPTVTTKRLAHEYNVHRDFMRQRIEQGGIPAYIQAQRGYIMRRMRWGRIEEEQPHVPTGKTTCKRCELIIPGTETYCKWCQEPAKELNPYESINLAYT